MLRRVNAALFEAPPGARVQLVVDSQQNNGVKDARFEYAGNTLPRQTILGLPGCTVPVANSSELLEVGVVFDPAAPGTARYDLFEVENGVPNALQKSVKHSDSTPLISFTIDPVAVPAVVTGMAPAMAAAGPPNAAPAPKRAKKRGRKAAAKAKRKTKTTKKNTTKKNTTKAAARRRPASRKRTK